MKKIIATLALSVAFIHPALGSDNTFSAESYSVILNDTHKEQLGKIDKASVFVQNKKMDLVLETGLNCSEICLQSIPWPLVLELDIKKVYRSRSLCAPITYQASSVIDGVLVSVNLTMTLQSDNCPNQGKEIMIELSTEENQQVYTSTLLFENIKNFSLSEDTKFDSPNHDSLIELPIIIASI